VERTDAFVFFACLGTIDLADYLHSDRSSLVGRSNFLKLFHDASTLELSQRFDGSPVKILSILEALHRHNFLPTPTSNSTL
jgi:hypothetical protein